MLTALNTKMRKAGSLLVACLIATPLFAESEEPMPYSNYYLVKVLGIENTGEIHPEKVDGQVKIQFRNEGKMEAEVKAVIKEGAKHHNWDSRLQEGRVSKNNSIETTSTFLTKYAPDQNYLIQLITCDASWWWRKEMSFDTVRAEFTSMSSENAFALSKPIEKKYRINGYENSVKLKLATWSLKQLPSNSKIKPNSHYLIYPSKVTISSKAFLDKTEDTDLNVAIEIECGEIKTRIPEKGYKKISTTTESFTLTSFLKYVFLLNGEKKPTTIRVKQEKRLGDKLLFEKKFDSWIFSNEQHIIPEEFSIDFKTFGPVFEEEK